VSGVTFDREQAKPRLAELARAGVFLGTSSWKYPGWLGQLYERDRYVWRGRYAESRFERDCLADYAEVFGTVCVDAAYYKFPDPRYLGNLAAQVPEDFRFAFKVTDEITVKKFPNLPRFGLRAGKPNENFLNANLFASAFLAPCEPFRRSVGLLIFEFSRFYPGDFARGRDFLEALDGFLGKLPRGWPYGVEIRNANFLQPEYFATLARHSMTHVFNSWEAMPPVGEQLSLPGSVTNPDCAAMRLLLRPGRRYEDAVKLFSPYDRLKEPQPEGRAAAGKLIQATQATGQPKRVFVYVNNRFEGNALATIAAVLEQTRE
jgi:uncharacterized protein YecE (DUF72 family)